MARTDRERRRAERLAADPEAAARRRKQTGWTERGRKDTRKRTGRVDTRGPRSRPDRRKPYTLATIDGEGFEVEGESRYCLLQARGHRPIWRPQGLSTWDVFRYLFALGPGQVPVGFGLGYDFENWLRDVPDDLYLKMVNDGETVTWENVEIMCIPKKILGLKARAGAVYPHAENPDAELRVTVYDALGYYQTGLVSALRKEQIEVDARIEAGKAARGGFVLDQRQEVTAYNSAELDAMEKLFAATEQAVNEGLRIAGLPFRLTQRDWYGPGALAKKFLHYAKWPEQHPALHLPEDGQRYLREQGSRSGWKAPFVEQFPYSAAYFGGRIEQAAVGRWASAVDWDLHSAYPCAMTRLPTWGPEDGIWLQGRAAEASARGEACGMYDVEWEFPEGWDWYPLPYRNGTNVYFPRHGRGWIMSPELCAVAATAGWQHMRVHAAWILSGTQGAGAGVEVLDPAWRSIAAGEIERCYAVRQQLLAAGSSAQLAVKLFLNSSYGKLWQQVGVDPKGDLKLFNDLSGAWVTAWTRAMIWRAVWGRHVEHQVVAIQTDGVVALAGLAVDEGPGLGQWEQAEFRDYRQFVPGIYDYQEAGGRKGKTRGYSKMFDHDRAWEVVEGKAPSYSYRYRYFVGRRHALAQPDAMVYLPGSEERVRQGDSRYQWREQVKRFVVRLGSKRTEPDAAAALAVAVQSLLPKLVRQAWAEQEKPWRDLYDEVKRVTGGRMIRPADTRSEELPAPLKRRASPHTLDGTAQMMGLSEEDLLTRIEEAWWHRSRKSWDAIQQEVIKSLEPEVAALVREAQEAEAARRVAPAWTAPKPNGAWVQRGRISTPFKLKFRVTPFVNGDLDEDMRLEDAAGEEGVFVAGIGE